MGGAGEDIRLFGQGSVHEQEEAEAINPPLRAGALEFVGPTCLLDSEARIVDWNPAFSELIAKPLQIVRMHRDDRFGLPADALAHSEDAEQVRTEPIDLQLPGMGLISFRKITSELIGSNGQVCGWSVHLIGPDQSGTDVVWPRIIHRLKHEITWSKYAAVYDDLLLNFSRYRQLVRDVANLVAGAKRCVDLGSGTGNTALQLLKDDRNRRVCAVDSNAFMLRRFRAKLPPEFSGRMRILKNDIQSMPYFDDGVFDAATMVNTLYALDHPADCLSEVHRILSDSGVLAICTPHRMTDVDKLFESLSQELQGRNFDQAIQLARARHRTLDSKIHESTIEELICMLDDEGFDVESHTLAYVDAVVLIRARKR